LKSDNGPVASNNLFKDMWISNTDSSDVYVETLGAGSDVINNTFLNVSYSDVEGSSLSTGLMEIIRKWYYQAYVNDSDGDAVVANVSATNFSGVLEWTVMSDSTGWIPQQEITDYVQYYDGATATSYYSNYTINATNSSYNVPTVSTSYNVTLNNNSLIENFEFVGVDVPSEYKFDIRNSSGGVVASFDDEGNAYFLGIVSESESSLNVPDNSFVVQNSSGATVVYINNSGSMFMLGTISVGDELDNSASVNFEFRNATKSLVSFFDDEGNLKLKGGYLESYVSP